LLGRRKRKKTSTGGPNGESEANETVARGGLAAVRESSSETNPKNQPGGKSTREGEIRFPQKAK